MIKNIFFHNNSCNSDIKLKDLSTRKRNIISVCYFFEKMLENTSEINLMRKYLLYWII